MAVLERIKGPADLKGLSPAERKTLAEEIRRVLLEVCAEKGGHIGANLGVVELAIALHTAYNSPEDLVIWDVGHQGYVHKMLTGRADRIHTVKQKGGLSGYLRRSESEHDAFGAGHASTSLGAAFGFEEAWRLAGVEGRRVVAVIGDGALTGGVALEALNYVGNLDRDITFVLNDNAHSISENVGALNELTNRIITKKYYNRLRDDIWELLGKLPRKSLAKRARQAASKIEESLKNLYVPSIIFEDLGYRYLGPLDGHDTERLLDTFSAVRQMHGTVFVHVITQKGSGYLPAEEDPVTFHGLGPFDLESGEPVETGGPPSYSSVFTEAAIELAQKDERVVAITAAMPTGTGLSKFKERFPDRFYDVGIAEQFAVLFSAALSLNGIKPLTAIYSTFLQRAYDQLIHDAAIQNAPVKLFLDRAGMVGADGSTHQGLFDLAYLRSVPGMVVAAPKDENELRDLVFTAYRYEAGPFAVRYPRAQASDYPEERPMRYLEPGTWERLSNGDGPAILAVGAMVPRALEAAGMLSERGIETTVINARYVKPMDEEMLNETLKRRLVVTIEEGVLTGGFGEGVAVWMGERGFSGRMMRLGVGDRFPEHASRTEQLEEAGLTPSGIAQEVGYAFEKLSRKPVARAPGK